MPGWQKVYEDLKDKGFEIIAAAQDTGGEAAAGRHYDRANVTFTALVDERHLISSLYNMVNVPTGVWIDETGRIVRPNEVAYSKDFSFAQESVNGDDYVAALRNWVEKGQESEFWLSAEEVAARIQPKTDNEALAEANFKLGVFFHERGDEARANRYWKASQELNPESWNYHRQDWSFTAGESGRNWSAKYRALDGKPYYTPLRLKKKDK